MRIRHALHTRRGMALTGVCLAAAAAGPASAATPILRFDGIGPLRIGMTATQARATGWLSNRSPGCELELPRPVGYRLDGPKAPTALTGSATFRKGRLASVSVSAGARTKLGVAPGTTRVTTMVSVYRNAGFKVTRRFDAVFQGTFVEVSRAGRHMGAFATGPKIDAISVPSIEVCE